MIRAGGLILVACLGLSPEAALAYQLEAAICQPGADFDPELSPGAGISCADALSDESFLGDFVNRTSFTEAECGMLIIYQDTPVASALNYIMMKCCIGAPLPYSGMCGKIYNPGDICLDPFAFDTDQEFDRHCNGDENMPEEVCKQAGEEAWDPSEDEPCDVGRVPVSSSEETEALCTLVGGIWEIQSCLEQAVIVTGMTEDQDQPHCGWYELGAHCCVNPDGNPATPMHTSDGCTHSEPYPPEQPQPFCIELDMATQEIMHQKGWTPVGCS
jgi:hypothetical protein